MPTIIPPEFCLVSQSFILSGAPHPFMVVTGHEWGGGFTADGVAAQVRDVWDDVWWSLGARPATWALGPSKALCRAAGGTLFVGENPTVTQGTGPGGNSIQANSAILIRKRTGIAGPRNRGRMFVPGFSLPESAVNEAGVMSSGEQAVHQTVANNLLAQFATRDLSMVILHTTADAPTPVTSLQVQALLGTQRTRMRP